MCSLRLSSFVIKDIVTGKVSKCHRRAYKIELGMESSREDIAKEVEEAIQPLIEKSGYMNAFGTLTVALQVIKGEYKN